MSPQRALIVGNAPEFRDRFRELLGRRGFEVAETATYAEAEDLVSSLVPSVMVLDSRGLDECESGGGTVAFVERVADRMPSLRTVVLCSPSRGLPTQSPGLGQPPLPCPEAGQGAGRVQILDTAPVPPPLATFQEPADLFLGESPSVRKLEREARRLLKSRRPVLLCGETGTGKGALARWFHRNGPYAADPYTELHCAGLTQSSLDLALFGRRPDHPLDCLEIESGPLSVRGTIFLDEIGDLDLVLQSRLLLAMAKERERVALGVTPTAVRIIAATHRDLEQLVQEQRFRQDLYFRLRALPLTVPPLRERREDVPLLAESLLQNLIKEGDRADRRLSPAAKDLLIQHTWRGNIRELLNALARALLVSDHEVLEPSDFVGLTADPPPVPIPPATPLAEGPTSSCDAGLTLEELERSHIVRVMTQVNGQVREAAQRLGISRSSLYSRLKRYRIEVRTNQAANQAELPTEDDLGSRNRTPCPGSSVVSS